MNSLVPRLVTAKVIIRILSMTKNLILMPLMEIKNLSIIVKPNNR